LHEWKRNRNADELYLLLKSRQINKKMKPPLWIFLMSLLVVSPAKGQIPPIGQWRAHLPYGIGNELAVVDSKIFCSTPYSLFSYHTVTKELQQYNRMTGLSETGISHFSYNALGGEMVIGYANSNIDILTENRLYNIDGIKRKTSTAIKIFMPLIFSITMLLSALDLVL
jgi:hypothetical protein